jgi:hypothetical protein
MIQELPSVTMLENNSPYTSSEKETEETTYINNERLALDTNLEGVCL